MFTKAPLPQLVFIVAFVSLFSWGGQAQVPQVLSYQGRITTSGANFNGTGKFKFALIDGGSGQTYWSNDGTSVAGSEPSSAVTLPVSNGLYSVLLGDGSVQNMTPLPVPAFSHADVRLRVWFDDGVHGSQQLSPDQRLAATAFAMNSALAQSVPDGTVTAAKIANGAVGAAQLSPNLVFANTDASKINGQKLASLPSGLLTNTAGSGIPGIAAPGTDYVSPAQTQGQLYIMSSFVPSFYNRSHWGELYISTSQDGINWNPLNGGNSVYAESPGIIRDPKIFYDANVRTFLVAHTSGGEGETGQFYIDNSSDLLHWSQFTSVSSGGTPNSTLTWNPTWFQDPNDSTIHIFFSFSPDYNLNHMQIVETHPLNNPPVQLSDYRNWSAPAPIGPIMNRPQGFNEFQVFTSPEDLSTAYYAVVIDFGFAAAIDIVKNSGPLLSGNWNLVSGLGYFAHEGPFVNNLGRKLYSSVASISKAGSSAVCQLNSTDGLSAGMNVVIAGAQNTANTGVFQISVVNASNGSVTVSNSSALAESNSNASLTTAVYDTAGHWRFYCEDNSGTGYSWTDLDANFKAITGNLTPVNSAYPMENGYMLKVSNWMGMLGAVRPDTGTLSYQNADNVNISGGQISGLSSFATNGPALINGQLSVTGATMLGNLSTPIARLRHGKAILNGGSPATVVVADTTITENTRIFISLHTLSGASALPFYQPTARSIGQGFTITSSVPGDGSSVDYLLLEP